MVYRALDRCARRYRRIAGRASLFWFALALLGVLLQPSRVVNARHETVQARDLQGTLIFGGRVRSYLLHVPLSVSGAHPVPLLLVLHRANGTAAEMNELTHLDALADSSGLIVAYPNGFKEGWADGRGSSYADSDHIDDVGFLTRLVITLEGSYAIDPHQVAIAGISNGGFMAQRMACERADLFSAAISVAATLPVVLSTQCNPSRPIPLLFFEGTSDPLVPYNGGTIPGDTVQLLSSGSTARRWAQLDRCSTVPGVAAAPHLVVDGTAVVRTSYSGCAGRAAVVRYSILNGGHTWPGGWQYLPVAEVGKTSQNIDASAVIWSFMREHPGA